ncbi:Protein of unknown function DUF1796 [Paenibacillus curdlanolyticus YK9]|uniref:Papain-like cysteine peptidase n=1 Tax=Paenibacillus curdlanolyticus YK9 TaxID=717606 RepID=E0IFL7_9BACL|nr:DUF1796 family putative cysteine peptidase [Paenibacillus curdlanolyticus]EFM08683.1 Protein of unknown function DUF1796 [Paenibacillus curdlanolyticus YK9]
MELNEISGQYDAIFSLGLNCLPAIQLERNGIRPYTGVLDWVEVIRLTDVNRMINNRFSDFGLRHNLVYHGTAGYFLLLRDVVNGMIIVHDFPLSRNSAGYWPDYDAFRTKMDRRIERFLNKMASCRRILFVRTGGMPDEALELEQALKRIVKGEFHVLLVNHNPVPTLIEDHWPHKHVCAVTLPEQPDIWNANDVYWKLLLQHVHYTG